MSLRTAGFRIVAIVAALALAAVACGDDDRASSAPAPQPAPTSTESSPTPQSPEPAPPPPEPAVPADPEPAPAPPAPEPAPAPASSEPEPAPQAAAPPEPAPPPPPDPAPPPESAPPLEPEPLAELRIFHPETLAFAAPFTMLDTGGPLAEVAEVVSIDFWNTPDVLRSILVNGDTEVAAVPSYVGANLHNRGVDVRMAAVVVWGLLWLVGPEGTPATWESLRGQTVMIPFPNDMPDLVFRFLAASNGLTPGEDFETEYYAQPPEIIGRLATGAGTWAVLPEHVVTLALAKANQNGQAMGRVFDLQEEWATATGTSPRIPQAGIVVRGELAAERPEVVAALLDALEASVAVVQAGEPDTLAALSEASGVPAPVVGQVIPRLNLEVVPAAEAQAELEQFFAQLATLSPDIIGGGLPDASFYLPDPR